MRWIDAILFKAASAIVVDLALWAVDAHFAVLYELIKVFIMRDYSHKYIFIFANFNRARDDIISLVALTAKAVKSHFFYHIYTNWQLLF